MNNFFSVKELLNLIWKWKIHVIAVTVFGALLSVIFSGPWIIEPKFKSSALLYPENLKEYSEESETEQLLQLLQSNFITNRLIEDFDLYTHYEIDPNAPKHKTYMLGEIATNISISKTKYETAHIEVVDKDPEIAKRMVDSIIKYYNYKVQHMHRVKWLELVTVDSLKIAAIETEIDSIKAEMRHISQQYGVVSVRDQSREITRALIERNSPYLKSVNANLQLGSSYIAAYQHLLEYRTELLAKLKQEYYEAIVEADKQITYCTIVSTPEVADKKFKPVRWVIVMLTTAATFALALIVIALLESVKMKTGDK